MCGLTGWIDYERDLTREEATLRRMTGTLALRGPDAGGLWISPHAALGHRRLPVIDIEGGKQPMFHRQDGRDIVCLSYTGEIYNFQDLRSELKARGHRFLTRCDTEVVLRGYLEWGEGVADRLNGMFAFAVWDARAEELLLVRDRVGLKPLYYSMTPGGVLFGSEPKAIFASGLVTPAIDERGLCAALSLVRAPGEAIFRGMSEVRPGELIRVTRGGSTRRRYWTLEAREHREDLETTIRTVRELLEDSVRRQLIADVPICSLLSGGLDSSVITAMAQKQLARDGAPPLRSFTLDFASPAGPFLPDEMRSTPDLPYAHAVAEGAGTDHTDITLDASELASPEAWHATLTARDLPPLGDMDTSFYLMCNAVRRHAIVALTGGGAEDLLGGHLWLHDPKATAAETFPWLVASGRLGRPAAYEPRLRAGLDVAAYQAEQYREAMAEVPRLAGEVGQERRMRELTYLHLTRFLPHELDREDRLSMAVALEIRVPFLDHRLIEYLYNVPWFMKSFDGREKSILRTIARDLLPESVVRRVKVAYPTTQDPAYHGTLRHAVCDLLAAGTAPVLSILSRPAVRALASMPPSGAEIVRLGLERVLRLNQWLEQYRVRLDLQGA